MASNLRAMASNRFEAPTLSVLCRIRISTELEPKVEPDGRVSQGTSQDKLDRLSYAAKPLMWNRQPGGSSKLSLSLSLTIKPSGRRTLGINIGCTAHHSGPGW